MSRPARRSTADDAQELPEADRLDGAPHPRETATLFGQDEAERRVLDAVNAGRAHHAWLISGPRGVGKATLAWRIARFLLARDPDGGSADSLDVPADHPVAHRTRVLSEPRLLLIRRGVAPDTGRLRSVITVDETRRLRDFFGMSAADGGARVVIVDAADEMNPNAANALLKLLEEPPPDATLLLVSHAPARLLPTIRSRCRDLRCAPLGADDLGRALAAAGLDPGDGAALSELAGGSVGMAHGLLAQDGVALYARLVETLATLPRLDRPRVLALADAVSGRGAEPRFDLLLTLTELLLARLARTGVGHPPSAEAVAGEAATLARLAPDETAARAWADLHQTLGARSRAGRAVNLDPAALVLDMWLRIEAAANGRPTAP